MLNPSALYFHTWGDQTLQLPHQNENPYSSQHDASATSNSSPVHMATVMSVLAIAYQYARALTRPQDLEVFMGSVQQVERIRSTFIAIDPAHSLWKGTSPPSKPLQQGAKVVLCNLRHQQHSYRPETQPQHHHAPYRFLYMHALYHHNALIELEELEHLQGDELKTVWLEVPVTWVDLSSCEFGGCIYRCIKLRYFTDDKLHEAPLGERPGSFAAEFMNTLPSYQCSILTCAKGEHLKRSPKTKVGVAIVVHKETMTDWIGDSPGCSRVHLDDQPPQ